MSKQSFHEMPPCFDGWSFVSDKKDWKHYGETIVVQKRNATDSSYYDCIAPDGSSPAVSDNHLREMFKQGKLIAPE
jgi:hypothetical protein